MREIELKFLEIDESILTKHVLALGAKLVYEAELRSQIFCKAGEDTSFDAAFVRLRSARDINSGSHTHILACKSSKDSNSSMSSRDEIEVQVLDVDAMVAFLTAQNYLRTSDSAKHRKHYVFEHDVHGAISFEFDKIESIPIYLEIETSSESAMREMCKLLKLDISSGKNGMIVEYYPHLIK